MGLDYPPGCAEGADPPARIRVDLDVTPADLADPEAFGERVAAAIDAADPTGTLPVTIRTEGPRVAIISSAELATQPGAPLTPDYWVSRRPGESYPDFLRRRRAEDMERRARKHEAAAAALRLAAAELREGT